MTQLALDVIFRSLGRNILDCNSDPTLEHSIGSSEASEAAVFSASAFLDTVYADAAPARASSRAPTPMLVRPSTLLSQCIFEDEEQEQEQYPQPSALQSFAEHTPCPVTRQRSVRMVSREDSVAPPSPLSPWKQRLRGNSPSPVKGSAEVSSGLRGGQRLPKHFMTTTTAMMKKTYTKQKHSQGDSIGPGPTPSRRLYRPSAFPQQPDISALSVSSDPSCDYAVVISMYEVYNDRIFDLLTPPIKSVATKEYRRRPLLFKSTESSPDRKVVAGLRKVVCGSLNQALMVLEAGLHERRVAGTGSNSVSSRSHGFFCVEVKKRHKGSRRNAFEVPWGGSTLTIVDLAGSERARDAKTAGATLAEAGKINESLMYLGQCLQMQSDAINKDKVLSVPMCIVWYCANQCSQTWFPSANASLRNCSSPTVFLRQPHTRRHDIGTHKKRS